MSVHVGGRGPGHLCRKRSARGTSQTAAVVVLLGQSLNWSRTLVGGDTVAQQYADASAVMPVAGVSTNLFPLASTNVEFTPNGDNLASFVAVNEGTLGQSPAAGVVNTLSGPSFSRIYVCSAAIGSRSVGTLRGAGPRAQVYALVHKMCNAARAAGFSPVVMFALAHGEADASAGTTEAAYYADMGAYMRMCQLAAAQAMRSPQYVAPIAMSYPLQSNSPTSSGANDRPIKEALRRLAIDIPNVIDIGPAYQWPAHTDLVHPLSMGYVQRGEAYGRALLRFYQAQTEVDASLQITNVTLSGNTFTATWSAPIARDASTTWGSALSGTDGYQWVDNGTPLTISNLVYSGNTVSGTLSATPSGTLAQQVLRYAQQGTPATGTSPANLASGYTRSTTAGWVSTVNPSYTTRVWGIPQSFSNVSAA